MSWPSYNVRIALVEYINWKLPKLKNSVTNVPVAFAIDRIVSGAYTANMAYNNIG